MLYLRQSLTAWSSAADARRYGATRTTSARATPFSESADALKEATAPAAAAAASGPLQSPLQRASRRRACGLRSDEFCSCSTTLPVRRVTPAPTRRRPQRCRLPRAAQGAGKGIATLLAGRPERRWFRSALQTYAEGRGASRCTPLMLRRLSRQWLQQSLATGTGRRVGCDLQRASPATGDEAVLRTSGVRATPKSPQQPRREERGVKC